MLMIGVSSIHQCTEEMELRPSAGKPRSLPPAHPRARGNGIAPVGVPSCTPTVRAGPGLIESQFSSNVEAP